MARFDRSKAPYYDNYESYEKGKNYTHMLAVPGRVAQAREFTQMQSLVKDIIKGIGDSIMDDGDIVEGVDPNLDKINRIINIPKGKIYVNGIVFDVEEQKINLPDNSTLTGDVYYSLEETIIGDIEDTEGRLRDPALGYDNYNQPGCHRVQSKIIFKWVERGSNEELGDKIIASYINGDRVSLENVQEYSDLTRTLARRTEEESGSYVVDGYSVRVSEGDGELTPDGVSANVTIIVSPGKAYVNGFEIEKGESRITTPRALTSKPSYNDLSLIHEDPVNPTIDNLILEYKLNNLYIDLTKSITVSGLFRTTIPRDSTADSVPIDREYDGIRTDKDGLYRAYITKSNGEEDGTYINSTHFIIDYINGNYVLKWLSETRPSGRYGLSFVYRKEFKRGEDEDYTIQGDTLKWLNRDASKLPVDRFTVSYSMYLARKDLVYIDEKGVITVKEGIPDMLGYELAPDTPPRVLPLALVHHTPAGVANSSDLNFKISISSVSITRFTMSDIHKLLKRIKKLEYDQAVISLNTEAKQQYQGDKGMVGIFTDPLIDFSRVDTEYREGIGTSLVHNITIDVLNNLCYLPTEGYNYYMRSSQISPDSASKFFTLDTTGEYREVLSQKRATGVIQVNPYSTFPQSPEISISPAVDSWINEDIISVAKSLTSSEVVDTDISNIELFNTSGAAGPDTVVEGDSFNIVLGTRVEKTTTENSILSERASTFINSRVIHVEGSYFPSGVEIAGYFDGIPVSLGDPEGTDTTPKTIRTSEDGTFSTDFRIPKSVPTGIKEVKFSIVNSSDFPNYDSSATALYQATGIDRVIQQTVTTLVTTLLRRVTTVYTTHNIDPIGQTFILDKMTLLKGVNLYFQQRPKGQIPITCEIREVVNGQITPTSYGHKTLSRNDVKASTELGDKIEATQFIFDDPILLDANKEYAIVVTSTSEDYTMWIAELGKTDVIDGKIVLSNPYLVGNMFSSSNNSSWTVHQMTDIKFDLLADNYETDTSLEFDEITDDGFSRVCLLADAVTPHGTSIRWSYSVPNSEGNYTAFSDISPRNILALSSMRTKIRFKVDLHRDPEVDISPILVLDSVCAKLSKYKAEGVYVSQPIENLDEYNHVDIIVDTYTDGVGTEIGGEPPIEVSILAGEETQSSSEPDKMRDMKYGWKERTYSLALYKQHTSGRIFVRLASTNQTTPAFRRLRVIFS